MARQFKNRLTRQPIVKPKLTKPKTAKTIFLSGGVGDIITLESYFTDEQRFVLKSILYATPQQETIKELFKALPNYPNLLEHRTVWSDFSNFWCFCSREQCVERIGGIVDPQLMFAEDWSIDVKFPGIEANLIKYGQSSFLKYCLCDINKFSLPPDYVVISPFSADKRLVNRDFNDANWEATIARLKSWNIKGVIINKGGDAPRKDDCLIDLTNQTNIIEAIEILKRGRGYIGIDSWMTPLATKLFKSPYLVIKSNNDHCYKFKHIYFAPNVEFGFLMRELTFENLVQ